MGILFIVATPIGNLEDITVRALRILTEADVIFAEDTRVTKKLLSHYNITTPVFRLDAHTEKSGAEEVVGRLQKGERVVYVSDAGTPGISDPGARLAARARQAQCRIETIPGASSLTSALSIAGVQADQFVFLGFLPHKKGRHTLLQEIATTQRTVVLFESTHRIVKLLTELTSLGESFAIRTVIIARELTKIHEEVLVGSAEQLLHTLALDPQKQKGEFVVIIAPGK